MPHPRTASSEYSCQTSPACRRASLPVQAGKVGDLLVSVHAVEIDIIIPQRTSSARIRDRVTCTRAAGCSRTRCSQARRGIVAAD